MQTVGSREISRNNRKQAVLDFDIADPGTHFASLAGRGFPLQSQFLLDSIEKQQKSLFI